MAQNSKVGKRYSYNRPSNIILPKSKSLSVQTIKTWKDALELASLAENPNRAPLMELYESVLLDSHLASIIESRILRVIRSRFKMVDANGKDNADMMKLLETQWFNRFLFHAMTAKFKGSTVIELWDLDPETMQLIAANQIPSENVLFDEGLIVKEVGDEVGYPYREGVLEPFYIQVGTNRDLGLLKNVAPDALSKKFAKAAWVEYVEKYGIPPRWVTTDSFSDTRHQELAEMMASMVSNHWAVLQGNEKIDVMNSNGTDAYGTFDKLIERMNSEMSKRVLGQDGTTNSNDKSGTYGSLAIMQEVAEDRHEADKTDIRYLINNELLWRLEAISPAYSGITNFRFDWDESKELTPDELIESVGKLSSAGYEVDIKYLVEKTGIPITGMRQLQPPTETGDGEKKKPSPKQDLNALISEEIVSYYAEMHSCGGEELPQIEAVDLSNYTKLIEKLAKDIHSGKVKPSDLNEDLVRQTYKDLSEATGEGYGKSFYNYDQNAERKLQLKQNLYKFSGAKTYQQSAQLNYLLQDEKGNPRPFSEFRKAALQLNQEYNQNYLRTEFQTAQRAGAMAEKWTKYEDQAGVYPNLQYKTAKDERVRDDHKALEDVIKPVDDKFWDKWYPPNGWNCRCYVVQTDKPVTRGNPETEPTMGFQNNVGKAGKVFDEEHPYFVLPEDEVKQIRTSFEKMKLSIPLDEVYKNGKGKLEASVWSDPANIRTNLRTGKALVDSVEAKVQIRPQVDTNILKKESNATFSINGKTANLKEVKTKKDIGKGLEKVKTDSVVFNLDNSKMKALEIVTEVGQKIGKKISSIFFTRQAKAVELSRSEILKQETGKLENLLKD